MLSGGSEVFCAKSCEQQNIAIISRKNTRKVPEKPDIFFVTTFSPVGPGSNKTALELPEDFRKVLSKGAHLL